MVIFEQHPEVKYKGLMISTTKYKGDQYSKDEETWRWLNLKMMQLLRSRRVWEQFQQLNCTVMCPLNSLSKKGKSSALEKLNLLDSLKELNSFMAGWNLDVTVYPNWRSLFGAKLILGYIMMH